MMPCNAKVHTGIIRAGESQMQKDMHYYGTYAMARAAGITPNAAQTIATCAQFVDDNAADVTLKFKNGAWVESVATAHHTIAKENLDLSDQRRVWVPFHFLPGNIGNGWTERLKCRMDSDIAKQMVAHHLAMADKSYAAELIGIAAHVYADTFSHYGFSGISSRGNKVVNDSFIFNDLQPDIDEYIRGKWAKFRRSKGAKLQRNFQDAVKDGEPWWVKFTSGLVSWGAETLSGALGHGSVATFPDRPYLHWEFDYERADGYLESTGVSPAIHAVRPNPETFIQGCEALHRMFQQFRLARTEFDNGDGRDFEQIRSDVVAVLSKQAGMEGRIEAWQKAAEQSQVFAGGARIPEYQGEEWNDEWRNFDGAPDGQIILEKPVWHFYQAASMHRTYVLRDLLPCHGLIVD